MVNGRTIAEDMAREHEQGRLRDTFAAAALTGLLADDGDRVEHAMCEFAARAYAWADAMLRERLRTPTTHATPSEGSVQDRCTEHWLQHAHGRLVAGDSEPDVLADYGWVQITTDEREAIGNMIHLIETTHEECGRDAYHLRALLERLPT